MENYRERLWPSWWLSLALGLFLPATVLIFLPLSLLVGVTAGLAMWLGSWAVLAAFAPVVEVTQDGFRAGSARIPWTHVDRAEMIGKDTARAAKGVDLDARAWVVIRPWITPAVRVHIVDPDDPTPYWLVSTTRPERLAALIGQRVSARS